MTYILARALEPSTWAGIAALCVALASMIPNDSAAFHSAAIFFGALAAALKEKGSQS